MTHAARKNCRSPRRTRFNRNARQGLVWRRICISEGMGDVMNQSIPYTWAAASLLFLGGAGCSTDRDRMSNTSAPERGTAAARTAADRTSVAFNSTDRDFAAD